MSLQTWKDAFYPTEASGFDAFLKPITHSLRKWRGLTKTHRKRHHVYLINHRVLSDEHGQHTLRIDDTSCALCQKYLKGPSPCKRCPLYISRGNLTCDTESDNEYQTPYAEFTTIANPYRMIEALKLALIQFPEQPFK